MIKEILKSRLWRRLIVFSDNFSKKEKLILLVMSFTLLLEVILFFFYIGTYLISNSNSYALATKVLTSKVYADTSFGTETEKFMIDLKSIGIKSVFGNKITRTPFSVKGTLILINNDNVEVFEYPDHDTAMKEEGLLAKKYIKEGMPRKWKNIIHIYVRDKIVVFYMGVEKGILTALSRDEEFSFAKSLTFASNNSN